MSRLGPLAVVICLLLGAGCTGEVFERPFGEASGKPSSDPPEGLSDAGVLDGVPRMDALGPVDAGPLTPEEDDQQAVGIRIEEIRFNQAVAIPVVVGGELVGAEERIAPIVSSRPALVRGFWNLTSDFQSREIEGRLVLTQEGGEEHIFRSIQTIAGTPDRSRLEGVFHWQVPAENIAGGTQFRVSLLEVGEARMGDRSGSRIPATGDAPLSALPGKMLLDLMVVPMCGMRLSAADQEMIETYLYNTYPINELRVQYHAPLDDVCDLGQATYEALPRLRAEERAPAYRHYGGIIQRNCGGLAQGIDGLGMEDERSFSLCDWRDFGPTADLLAHELGHTHGRDHSFEDPSFPNENRGECGARVTYGYGLRAGNMPSTHYSNDIEIGFDWVPMQALIPPTDADCHNNFDSWSDFMGYNYPYWVSAYTYAAIAENIQLTSSWTSAGARGSTRGRTLRGIVRNGTIYWTVTPGVGDVPTTASSSVARFHQEDGSVVNVPYAVDHVHFDPSPTGIRETNAPRITIGLPEGLIGDHFELTVSGQRYSVPLESLNYR